MQIAHLDNDPSNNDISNLAFLCLEHHDEYDGERRQSKGLLIGEVKRYRDELFRFVAAWAVAPVVFGALTMEHHTIEGQYVRMDVNESAELTISRVSGAQAEYEVSGLALWGTMREAPRIGTLNFVANLERNRLEHRELSLGDLFRVTLQFAEDGLYIEEEGRNPNAGMSVRFGGSYKRHELWTTSDRK